MDILGIHLLSLSGPSGMGYGPSYCAYVESCGMWELLFFTSGGRRSGLKYWRTTIIIIAIPSRSYIIILPVLYQYSVQYWYQSNTRYRE